MAIKVRSNGQSLDDYVREAAVFNSKANDLAEIEPAYYTPDSNNGYPPDDIILDSLVFYAPLWLYKGSKFKSIDPYHHTCTVGGAFVYWTPQGRQFNSSTGKIDCGNSSLLSFGSGGTDIACTFIFWVNMTDASSFNPMAKGAAGAYEYNVETGADDVLAVKFYNSDASAYIGRKCSTALTAYEGRNIILAVTYDASKASSGVKLYLGTTSSVIIQVDDANAQGGVFAGMTAGAQPLLIGRVWDAQTGTGFIGEIAIYRGRVLSIQELAHHQQATSLRY